MEYEHSRGFEPPRALMRQLRRIRHNAELLYQGNGVWMLGEVRWNWKRYLAGMRIIADFWKNVREAGVEVRDDPTQVAFLREGDLMTRGFVWIRDYHGMPDGRIAIDYARMCWKEEHGLLDADFRQMAHESSDKTSLLRKTKLMEDRIRSEGRSDFSIVMKHRRSFTARGQLIRNRARAALLPPPSSRNVQ